MTHTSASDGSVNGVAFDFLGTLEDFVDLADISTGAFLKYSMFKMKRGRH